MRIGILSFKPLNQRSSPEEIRLKKEAIALGHKAQIFRVSRCQLFYDVDKMQLFYDGKKFPKYDLIIPRVSALRNLEIHAMVIKQFEMLGYPVLNRYRPICLAKNKIRTLQYLDNKGIPCIRTMIVQDPKYVDLALKKLGKPPIVIKTPFGSYGSGVVIAESKRAVKSAMDAIPSSIIMMQEYVKESKGKDARVFVVGGKIIGAMMRTAKKGEFRSNLELGGKSVALTSLSDEVKDVSLKATATLNLEVAGVDIIQTKRGPAVLEVNANPGFKGLEEATGLNIAQMIIKYGVTYAKKHQARMKRAGKR